MRIFIIKTMFKLSLVLFNHYNRVEYHVFYGIREKIEYVLPIELCWISSLPDTQYRILACGYQVLIRYVTGYPESGRISGGIHIKNVAGKAPNLDLKIIINKYSYKQFIHLTFRQESTRLDEKQGDVDFSSGYL